MANVKSVTVKFSEDEHEEFKLLIAKRRKTMQDLLHEWAMGKIRDNESHNQVESNQQVTQIPAASPYPKTHSKAHDLVEEIYAAGGDLAAQVIGYMESKLEKSGAKSAGKHRRVGNAP